MNITEQCETDVLKAIAQNEFHDKMMEPKELHTVLMNLYFEGYIYFYEEDERFPKLTDHGRSKAQAEGWI